MRVGVLVRVVGVALAVAVTLAGCGSGGDATADLQRELTTAIPKQDHRAVKSVSCLPHVSEVIENSTVEFQCLVRFADGASYSTPASIRNPSQQFGWGYYLCTWNAPGPVDITTTPLPVPTPSLAAASPHSLFYARNLAPALSALTAHFAGGQLILALALYSGALEAMVGANGSAQRVTVDAAGKLTVNARSGFDGSRTGVEIAQLDPSVPQRLAAQIAARGHVAIGGLARFVLDLTQPSAAWDIYPSAGSQRFRAGLTGDSLAELTPTSSRPLS